MKLKLIYLLLIPTLTLCSCDDDTVSVGSEVLPDMNKVETSSATYSLNSRSYATDSVRANTNTCYLGSIVDPETRAKTTCNFLAQYHILENFTFPDYERIVTDETGAPVCDSCYVQLRVTASYGDKSTPLRLAVYELDTLHVMKEGVDYYTDIRPEDYMREGETPLVDRTFTLQDLVSTTGSTVQALNIALPKDYGRFILQKFYESPSYFRNSYQFLHHVCPGLYFATEGGSGAMINIDLSTLTMQFQYHSTTSAGLDTIVSGWQIIGATEEVIQNTHVSNEIPASMLDPDNDYTYLKSPAGIYTLVDIPVDEIVAGEYYTDTINSARIIFPCIQSDPVGEFKLEPPTSVLMVQASEMYSFFEQNKIFDKHTSFIATYDASTNAYVYDNIASLITQMKLTRDAGAGVIATDSEAARRIKYQAWEAEHPNWCTIALIPVTQESIVLTTAYTSSTKVLRVRNAMDIASAKLLGGPKGQLKIDVTYSRFK